jgi:hypothetical protein
VHSTNSLRLICSSHLLKFKGNGLEQMTCHFNNPRIFFYMTNIFLFNYPNYLHFNYLLMACCLIHSVIRCAYIYLFPRNPLNELRISFDEKLHWPSFFVFVVFIGFLHFQIVFQLPVAQDQSHNQSLLLILK